MQVNESANSLDYGAADQIREVTRGVGTTYVLDCGVFRPRAAVWHGRKFDRGGGARRRNRPYLSFILILVPLHEDARMRTRGFVAVQLP